MAKVKWSDLSAKQRARGMRRWHAKRDAHPSQPQTPPADRNPLYNPAVQLSGHNLKSAIDNIVAGQFRPVEQALDRQAKTSRLQNTALATRLAGYSGEVDKRAGVATARQEAIAERLSQALASVGDRAQATTDRVQSEEAARREGEVALQSAPSGMPNPIADELAALRARAGADTQAAGTAGALTGANYASLSNTNRESLQLRGQEQQGEVANRLANDLAEIRAKRADLGQQKGAERTKQLLGLRQSGFENLVTARGLGLKQAQLQADIDQQRTATALAKRKQGQAENANAFNQANTAADNARADRSLRTTEARDAYQREHRVGPYKPASKPAGAKESATAQKLKIGVENAAADFKQLLNGKDAKGRTRTVPRVQEILRKRGAPPIVILAAGDLAQFGYVTPAHLKSLRIAGIQIPKAWRRPRGAKAPKPAAPGPSASGLGAGVGSTVGAAVG